MERKHEILLAKTITRLRNNLIAKKVITLFAAFP